MDSLFIIIPAYNEEQTISTVIDEWYKVIEKHPGNGKSRLVIVNDGSKDATYDIMVEESKKREMFTPITKPNGGHGSTVLFGYHYALENEADYIFQTDSDGQTSADEFENFWQQREDNDMVIGWRNQREDGFSRIIVTNVLKLVLKLCFGVWITDANTPFRLIKSCSLRQHIDKIPQGFNLSNVLLSVLLKKSNSKVTYVPITFKPRQGGVNSINLRKIIAIGWQAIKDFRTLNRNLNTHGN